MTKPLIDKIREGIEKSGFPLEMKIGNILQNNNWRYSIGNIYEDFETGKFRESDISASKLINGIQVDIFIECKKSVNRQIVLYAPKNQKKIFLASSWFKYFPKVKKFSLLKQFYENTSKLLLFDEQIPFSKSLIVMTGDKVTEENIKYLSSINGLIKRSISTGRDGYIETNFRILFFYVVIFDGELYQLSSSLTENFDLKEIDYGQYEYTHKHIFNSEFTNDKDLIDTAKMLGDKYVVEFMKPEIFENHLLKLEESISNFDNDKLKFWGDKWPIVNLNKK
ncbi:hypothetical protein CO230_03950 [Chryseobacterium sp. 6424]|uniref:hypothetical protein n=1 Tax=Chryseobacterium sp. 6424 TaxID=2039166 RepID=UPI000EFD2B65|nr:hypothetical protein [Chryseobacterium sp. 6424]AYO57349.1 hypothetical protein CO230_03950 [Chryseobacterium sp. 6424]